MPSQIDQRENIADCLGLFQSKPFAGASRQMFETLGYKSDRRIPIATPKQFREQLDPQARLTANEVESLGELQSLHLLFQLTDTELGSQRGLFDSEGSVLETKIESYLFFAGELAAGHYSRTDLSKIIRAVNKPLPMPAIVLLKHGERLSLGIIHRRLHKRDQARDVLEKVTLIKDMDIAEPIRAHLEILNDFALPNLDADFGVSNFVSLHEAWRKRLDTYELSKGFYREIADWYFWAHHQVEDGTIRLPQHCDTEQEQSLFLIRLLTRVIFCWFLVEKHLIPTDLFRERRLKSFLKEFHPSQDPKRPDASPAYYRAILQNLFFGTLNMPLEQREFRKKAKAGQRYDQNYGVTNLWRYQAYFRDASDWEAIAKRIPFLNGGLFDCLDDKSGKKRDNFILDGFSDREDFGCHLPNDLFFGPERTVDLSRDYGEEEKRTARSKKARVRGLIGILSRYKFTIEENTPLEEEIALDPELLGKVFENLLASYNEDTRTTARKALGAFYTPREIVSYMVDEAIKSYLATQVPGCKGALEDLFSNKATLKEIKPDTKDKLIAAIGRVKILDPACGSGAFPMGALHRLVDLLQKLDPNNESWKRDRLADARSERKRLVASGASNEQLADADARIEDIENSFNSRLHALDFGRKLYLIESCIYGVDIQPIATQIAKLRFFVSLIVDQRVDTSARNLGVRPLPNLETRLVAADTLIPIGKSESDLFSADLDRLRAELAEIRHEHFNARTPATKRKWQEKDQLKRQEIAALLEREHAIPRESAKMLASWDPYDQNAFTQFFDAEWMFGRTVADAGRPKDAKPNEYWFDIVIGNPPYVRQEKIKHLKGILQSLYRVFDGRADLLVYFYEAGLSLLRPGGVLALITSNKFLRAGYGEPLRRFLSSRSQILSLIDFGDLPVFDATAYPCVAILRNAPPAADYSLRTVRIASVAELERFTEIVKSNSHYRLQSELSGEVWQMGKAAVTTLLSAIKTRCRPLKEIVKDRIYAGIKTGLNDAFIITGNDRDALVRKHKLSAEIIRPFLKGKDIGKWSPLSRDRYIIYCQHGIDIDRYPAIKEHLRQFKPRLEQRALDQNWFELQQPQEAFTEAYASPKIVYPNVALGCRFAWDEASYLDMTSFCVASDDIALLLVLNCSVMQFYFQHIGIERRGGYQEFKTQYVRELPIPSMTDEQRQVLIRHARQLVWLHGTLASQPQLRSERDGLLLAYLERIANGLAIELYFPEEVRKAKASMFGIVSAIPDRTYNGDDEVARFSAIRKATEHLYDSSHPLRIALDTLQTLDIVRTIEGVD